MFLVTKHLVLLLAFATIVLGGGLEAFAALLASKQEDRKFAAKSCSRSRHDFIRRAVGAHVLLFPKTTTTIGVNRKLNESYSMVLFLLCFGTRAIESSHRLQCLLIQHLISPPALPPPAQPEDERTLYRFLFPISGLISRPISGCPQARYPTPICLISGFSRYFLISGEGVMVTACKIIRHGKNNAELEDKDARRRCCMATNQTLTQQTNIYPFPQNW